MSAKADRVTAENDQSPTSEGRFFGYPETLLGTTWTLREICVFFGVSERKARDLLKHADAPPPLRLGSERCDRWNPYEVVAWAHHEDWRRLRWTNTDTTTNTGDNGTRDNGSAPGTGDNGNGTSPRISTTNDLPGQRKPSRANAAADTAARPATPTRAWRPKPTTNRSTR